MSEAGHTERLEAALDGKYRIERRPPHADLRIDWLPPRQGPLGV